MGGVEGLCAASLSPSSSAVTPWHASLTSRVSTFCFASVCLSVRSDSALTRRRFLQL
eukprot:SAG11_NODE_34303_length_272_cov_1.791908_1_plen_56_part_10